MKYGLKTIFRTPAKTVLFALLLAAATAFLSLGAGMWQSADNMLKEADETFMTAGEFVYMLGNYPDTAAFDPRLQSVRESFDIADYAGNGALSLEENIRARAFVDGYIPLKDTMPLGNYAIITINTGVFSPQYDAYASQILETHYSAPNARSDRQLTNAYLSPVTRGGIELKERTKYLVFGYFYTAGTEAVNRFQVLDFIDDLGVNPEYGSFPPIIELDGDMEAFWASDAGKYYTAAAEVLRAINASADIVSTKQIEAVEEFHRGEYKLVSGEWFTEADYESGEAVIVPKRFADQLELSVGDSVALAMLPEGRGFGRGLDFWPDEGYTGEGSFTVRGIYDTEQVVSPLYVSNPVQAAPAADPNSYTLGRVIVENSRAEEYLKFAQEKLPDGVRLELYDQGYGAAARSLLSMRETAKLITIVCLLAGLLIIWLFGFLFVFRSGETVKILLMLGSGQRRTLAFLLTGCGLITLFASLVGAVAGYFVSQSTIASVYDSIVTSSSRDNRFSVTGFGTKSAAFTAVPEVDLRVYILLAVAVLLVTMLLCAIFAALAMRKRSAFHRDKKDKKRESKGAPAKGARLGALHVPLPGKYLRYGVTSILRGGGRSLAVPLIFAVLVVFLCVFSGMREGYQARLERVYDEIPVSLKFTDVKGKRTDGLYITDIQTNEMAETGFTAEEWTSVSMRYMYNGVYSYADGTLAEPPPEPFTLPTEYWELQLFLSRIGMLTAPIVVTDEVEYAPEFFYSASPEITWLDGIGWEDYLPREEAGAWRSDRPSYCLVSEGFLKEHGLNLGDYISITVFYFGGSADGAPLCMDAEFVVGGTFPSERTQSSLYVPSDRFALSGGTSTIDEKGNIVEENYWMVYNAAGFMLRNTENLSEFKDWLSVRYDPVGTGGMNRKWVIIDDKALYDTIDQLNRYIGYMDMMYPVILVLVAGIGFIAANLMLRSRRREIALLRSMGTKRGGVFRSLFWEQLVLCLPGAALGLGLAALVLGEGSSSRLIIAAMFTLCYLLGACAAILQTQRLALMRNLLEAET